MLCYVSFAGIEIPKFVDTVTPQYKPKFEALVRTFVSIQSLFCPIFRYLSNHILLSAMYMCFLLVEVC